LKDLRVRRGLSLRRLGRLAHYSHNYLWDLETGRKRPSTEVAYALDAAFGADGQLSVSAAGGTAVVCTDDAVHAEDAEDAGQRTPARSAVLSGALPGVAAVTLTVMASPTAAVRVVIDAGPSQDPQPDAPAGSAGGARVYSLARARAARAVRVG
jgi:transcriptional regulator with XRE-family HTH domain